MIPSALASLVVNAGLATVDGDLELALALGLGDQVQEGGVHGLGVVGHPRPGRDDLGLPVDEPDRGVDRGPTAGDRTADQGVEPGGVEDRRQRTVLRLESTGRRRTPSA